MEEVDLRAMTFDNPGWSLLDRGGRLETLDREEVAAFSARPMSAVSATAPTSGLASCQ